MNKTRLPNAKTLLLLGASALAMLVAEAAHAGGPLSEHVLVGGATGNAAIPTSPIPGVVTAPRQLSAQQAQTTADLAQAAARLQAALTAQANARAAAQATTSSVPNGLTSGGLVPDSGLASNGTSNPVITWAGANTPTQTTADGQTTVSVTQTQAQAILNWQTFNVGKNTTVNFVQQSAGVKQASWVALNFVNDPNALPSQILGEINAPGSVYLINHNGIIFGGSSQINVNALIASSANLSVQQFLYNGIYSQQVNKIYEPSFTGAGGAIVVNAGAQINTNTPAFVIDGGGFVMLLGTQVSNAGTITTPGGQALLAAGDNFVVQPGYGKTNGVNNTTSTTIGNLVTAQINTPGGGTSGAVSNTGILSASVGDVSMAGETVTQGGVIATTTSVATRGTVHLSTATDGFNNPDAFGNIVTAPGSVISVLPDPNSGTALDVQRSNNGPQLDELSNVDRSLVQMTSSNNIEFQDGSLVEAPNAQLVITATNRVQVDNNALLDVAGLQNVVLPMSSNLVPVTIEGYELRDAPVNRDTALLNNLRVQLDVNELDFVPAAATANSNQQQLGDTSDRYYTPGGLLEVSGEVSNMGHSIQEWMTLGGTVSFTAGSVVTQSQSVVNVAGGSVQVQGGYVPQYYLQASSGAVYSIYDAPANIQYTGLYAGFAEQHPRWVVSQTFTSDLFAPAEIYVNGYTQGRNAGNVVFDTGTVAAEGAIYAGVTNGSQQTQAPAVLDANGNVIDPFTYSSATAAVGGALFLGTGYIPANGNQGPPAPFGSNVVIGNPTPIADSVGVNDDLGARDNTTWLDAGLLNAAGFSSIYIQGAGNVAFQEPLALVPGGQLNVQNGGTDNIAANITVPGGSISIVANPGSNPLFTQNPQLLNGVDDIVVQPNVTLSTAGLWTNERLDGNSSVGQAYINGGSITLSASDGIDLSTGSVLNASAGGYVSMSGAIAIGTGGNVSVLDDQTDMAGGAVGVRNASSQLVLGGSIYSYGGSGSGIMVLDFPQDLLIANPGTRGSANQLVLNPSFFQQGFSTYKLFNTGNVEVAANTNVVVDEPTYVPGPSAASVASGSDPATALNVTLLPLYTGNPGTQTVSQRPGASLDIFTGQAAFNLETVTTTTTGFVYNGVANPVPWPYTVTGGNTYTLVLLKPFTIPNDSFYSTTNGRGWTVILPNGTSQYYPAGSTVPAGATLEQDSGNILEGADNYPNSAVPIPTIWSFLNNTTTVTTVVRPISLVVGAGASITVDPKQTVTLDSPGQITIEGNITAKAGKIDIENTGYLFNPVAGSYDPNGLSVWIGSNSTLDVSGIAETAVTPKGQPYGQVLNGGSIILGSSNTVAGGTNNEIYLDPAYVIVRPGAVLDASGASAVIDTVSASDLYGSETPTLVGSNGGSIMLASYFGIYMDGTIEANSGGAGGGGGSLIVEDQGPALDVNENTPPPPSALPPDSWVAPSDITITQSTRPSPLSATLQPGATDPSLVVGPAYFSIDQIKASGFDNVSFYASDEVNFVGNLTLSVGRSIKIAQGSITDSSSNSVVNLNAPYVDLVGVNPVEQSQASFVVTYFFGGPSAGGTYGSSGVNSPTLPSNGTLNINANLVDYNGQVNFGGSSINLTSATGDLNLTNVSDNPGFGTVNFNVNGDLRLQGGFGSNSSLPSTTLFSRNLNITAAQIYPVAGATAEIADSNVLTFSRISDVVPQVPYQGLIIDGSLTISAPTINQGGIIRFPEGSINFFGTTINLLPGSITSASLEGQTVPWGGTTDGQSYAINGLVSNTLYNGFASPPYSQYSSYYFYPNGPYLSSSNYYNRVGDVPAIGVGFTGTTLNFEPGSTIDYAGGGDLAGAGFITGRGGSVDTLVNPFLTFTPGKSVGVPTLTQDPVFAIVPQSGESLYSPGPGGTMEAYAGSVPQLGEQITIPAGVPGLPAGTYTLLPSNYALNPGAYRVQLDLGTAAPGATVNLGNGSYAVAGATSVANTGVHGQRPFEVVVSSAAAARDYSNYDEQNYAQFGDSLAAASKFANPVVPADAGALDLNFNGTLTAAGTVLSAPAPGGQAGVVSIGTEGSDIEIYGTSPNPNLNDPGVTPISATTLNDLSAHATLIVGAYAANFNFGDAYGYSPYDVQLEQLSGALTMDQGAVLQGQSQVYLTAVSGSNGITIAPGTTINTTAGGPSGYTAQEGYTIAGSGNYAYYLNPQVSVLAVTNGTLNFLGYGSAPITVETGATLYSANSIFFATSGNVVLQPDVTYGAKDITFASNVINVANTSLPATDAEGNAIPTGFLLNQNVLNTLVAGDPALSVPGLGILNLVAQHSINFYGSLDLNASDVQISISTPAIYGESSAVAYGTAPVSDVATLSGNNIVITANGTPKAINVSNDPSAILDTLNLIGKTVTGSAGLTLNGFNNVNLTALNDISGSITAFTTQGATPTTGTGGNMTLSSPLVTGPAGTTVAYTTGNQLTLSSPGPSPTPATINSLGVEIDLVGNTISVGTHVEANSGKIVINVPGDVNLNTGADLDVSGQAVQLENETEYTAGGTILVTSTGGNINQAAGSLIDLSAVNNNAGSVTFTAVNSAPGEGNVLLAGAFNGNSAQAQGVTTLHPQGSITVNAQNIGDFDALTAILNAGNVGHSRTFDIQSGDLTINNPINAQNVDISVDSGSITVNGTINASGATPGSISLAAQNDLTIASTGVLDAHSTVLQVDAYGQPIDAENRAAVALTSASGALNLDSGATIDVSSPEATPQGVVNLNVSRSGETSGDANINATRNIAIKGASTIAVNAFWTYMPAAGNIVQDNGSTTPVYNGEVGMNQVDATNTIYVDNALTNADLLNHLSGLIGYTNAFHFRPGVEIESSAASGGNLTVASDIDLHTFRYFSLLGNVPAPDGTGAGEPGVIVIRAANNLTIDGSISDGFGYAPATPDDVLVYNFKLPAGTPLTQNTTLTFGGDLAAGSMFPTSDILDFSITINGVAGSYNTVSNIYDVLGTSINLTGNENLPQLGFYFPTSVSGPGTAIPDFGYSGGIRIRDPFTTQAPWTIPSGATDTGIDFVDPNGNNQTTFYPGQTVPAGWTAVPFNGQNLQGTVDPNAFPFGIGTDENPNQYYGGPQALLKGTDVPVADASTINTFFPGAVPYPVPLNFKANVPVPATVVLTTVADYVTPSPIKLTGSETIVTPTTTYSNTTIAAGTDLPVGTTINGGVTLPSDVQVGTVNWPANTPLSDFDQPSISIANDINFAPGAVLPTGTVLSQTIEHVSGHSQEFAVAPMLPQGDLSWSMQYTSGANLNAASVKVVQTPYTLASNGETGTTTLNDPLITDAGLVNAFGPTGGFTAPAVVRTGTGDLSFATGGDFLVDSLYGIYTAGTQSPTVGNQIANPNAGLTNPVTGTTQAASVNEFDVPRGLDQDGSGTVLGSGSPSGYEPIAADDYQAYYPTSGGNLTLKVQGNLAGYEVLPGYGNGNQYASDTTPSTQVGNWLWRQGGGSISGLPTAWWINFGTYAITHGPVGEDSYGGSSLYDPNIMGFTGFGTLGGGNVTIMTGGDAGTIVQGSAGGGCSGCYGFDARGFDNALDVAVGSTGRVLDNGTLVETGGGNLTIHIGGVIDPTGGVSGDDAGVIVNTRGSINVDAGAIDSAIEIIPGDSPVTVQTRDNLAISYILDPGTMIEQNFTPWSDGNIVGNGGGIAWFSLYTNRTDVSLISAGGDVSITENPTQHTTGSAEEYYNDGLYGFTPALDGDVLPANLRFVATSGSISVGYFTSTPSPTSDIQLLAADNVSGSFAQSADPVADVPTPLANPTTGLSAAFEAFDPNTGGIISNLAGTPPLYFQGERPAYADYLFAFNATPVNLHQNDLIPNELYAVSGTVSGSYSFAKPVLVVAGQDIDISGNAINSVASEVTELDAGNNINNPQFTIQGPGTLLVQAGNSINQGNLISSGPLYDVTTANVDSGASIITLAGVGPNGPDDTDFANLYLNPANLADPTLTLQSQPGKVINTYQTQLLTWLQQNYNYKGTSADALTYFLSLPRYAQTTFLAPIYFTELNESGVNYSNPASRFFNSYLQGEEAIKTYFPPNSSSSNTGNSPTNSNGPYTGNITLTGGSGITTLFGGSILALDPTGVITLGKEGSVIPPSSAGLITEGGGDVDVYASGNIELGLSRIFTVFGGNIIAWSNTGDINAGRGAKSTIVFTPAAINYNNYGDITLSPTVPSTGAGIATLAPIPGVPPGDVTLVAPVGTIDAGEAGIRVSGNLFIDALIVLNVANIQVQGKTQGLPPPPTTNLAFAIASTASTEAANVVRGLASQKQTELSVEVTGFGGQSDQPEECVPSPGNPCPAN